MSYPDGIQVKAILKEPVVWRVPKVLGVEVICMVGDDMDDLAVGGGDGGVLAVGEACPSTGSVERIGHAATHGLRVGLGRVECWEGKVEGCTPYMPYARR